MDEKQLKDMLSTLKAPAPKDGAKEKALAAAMAAFDQNIANENQGSDDGERLTGRGSTKARSNIMQKSHRLSGLAGGVALCALVAVLGTQFFSAQVKDLIGNEESNSSRIAISGGTKLAPAGAADADKEYRLAIEAENERKAKEAEAKGGSSMPIPIGKAQDDALSIPPAAKPVPSGDPLQEWRSKSEARRLSVEGAEEQSAAQSSAATTSPAENAPQEKGVVTNFRDMSKNQMDQRQNGAPASDMAAAPYNGFQAGQSYAPAKQAAGKIESRSELKKALAKDKEYEKTRETWAPMSGGRAAGDAVVMKADSLERMAGNKKMPAQSGPVNGGLGGGLAAESVAAPQLRAVPSPEPVVAIPAPPPPPDYYQKNYYQDEGRDSFPDFADNPVKATSAEPVSTFSIDVDTASYSFVRRMINQGQLPPKGSVRLEELINYFPYSYDLPGKDEDPFRPTVAVYKCPWKEDHKLVHIGIKGYDLTEKPHTNMVFLIDTSGSMNSPDKLPLAISSLKLALESLKADDTVGIVTYAGSSGVVLEPTKVSEKSKILNALDNLRSGGSTAGAAGIEAAYGLAAQAFVKEGNNRVLLATDGDFNVGISNPDQLKQFIAKKRGEGIFLSVLGFGTGNYQDTTMQALAQNGNGNAAYIDNLSEARKVLVQEAGATMFTIAKDVKIQVEFNPALVQEYRLIGYETRHLNREDFNNDKIDAGEIGAGHTVTAIYEITPVGATAMVDNLRYGEREKAIAAAKVEDKSEFSNELAFLKMRYKRPDSNTSTLMTRPISTADEKKWDDLSDDVRFAASVAGFGQLLRDSQYTAGLDWQQVIDMATAAKGKDEFGYRAEFINLLRLAKSQSGQK